MKKVSLKTNINCGGCIASVKPAIDAAIGENWKVDTENTDKILTATLPEGKSVGVLLAAIESRGFKAVEIR